MPDETFGYVLHPVDLAMNKVMAAAGRHELRDMRPFLSLKYHAIADAVADLGRAEEIRNVFAGFRKHLDQDAA